MLSRLPCRAALAKVFDSRGQWMEWSHFMLSRLPFEAANAKVSELTRDPCWCRSLAWWRSPVCIAWFMVGEV